MSGNNNAHLVDERDPSGRYIRYHKIIGRGGSKKVYLGFDQEQCMEIAWSKTDLEVKTMMENGVLELMCAELRLLDLLDHENIMRCYHSWIDYEKQSIHMITELFPSGNLFEFIRKHNLGNNMLAIKKWARQILQVLHYLHNANPPVVHRDIKCQNIFVIGHTGEIKLGDFGLALVLEHESSTEKFCGSLMAPEQLQGSYNQLIDIYSFGMCILQMVTMETPYSECTKDELLTMVSSHKMPAAFSRVTDPEVKEFINKCLCPASVRPSAINLLDDPFLAPSVSGTLTASSSLILEKPVVDEVVAQLLQDKEFDFEFINLIGDSICMSLEIKIGRKVQKINFVFNPGDTAQLITENWAEYFFWSDEDSAKVCSSLEEAITNVKAGASQTLKVPSEQDQAQQHQYREQEQRGKSVNELKRQQEVQEREGKDNKKSRT